MATSAGTLLHTFFIICIISSSWQKGKHFYGYKTLGGTLYSDISQRSSSNMAILLYFATSLLGLSKYSSLDFSPRIYGTNEFFRHPQNDNENSNLWEQNIWQHSSKAPQLWIFSTAGLKLLQFNHNAPVCYNWFASPFAVSSFIR